MLSNGYRMLSKSPYMATKLLVTLILWIEFCQISIE